MSYKDGSSVIVGTALAQKPVVCSLNLMFYVWHKKPKIELFPKDLHFPGIHNTIRKNTHKSVRHWVMGLDCEP